MDWQRTGLIAGIMVVLYLLLLEWNQFQESHQPPVDTASTTLLPSVPDAEFPQQTAPATPTGNDIPQLVVDEKSVEEATPVVSMSGTNGLIQIRTDVLEVTLDSYGGDIIKVGLPQHLTSQDDDGQPFILLNRTANQTYIAQSGLIGANGTDTADGRPQFSVAKNFYALADQDQLDVDLKLIQDGVELIKRFSFKPGSYAIDLTYLVNNQTSETWTAALFGQIKRDDHEPQSGGGMGAQPYLGAALTTPDKNFKKVSFDDLDEESFKTAIKGGWVAMVQHYFISAWVPDQTQTNHFNLRRLGTKNLYALGFTSPSVAVAPGETGQLTAQFYVGPKDQYTLERISPYLDLTVDYGWLWWIAKPIFYLLDLIHGWVGNWGWSIILLTVFIKLLFFKLSATSYRSMANMRKLQPEMTRLRELYGDDKQKLSQETMNLYKKEKVNPMGGCLPILVQMPVFISLYWVLLESVEMRHAPWILWITDLSVKDPFFILPLLMGASMLIQTRLNPAPPDPMQAKMMQIMPIAFTFFFMFFPAGLVLYWTVNNLLSILQQWVITRQIESAG